MKNIKLIIICCILILLTGCTATDTITITKDGKIHENVSIMEENGKVLYGDKNLYYSVDATLQQYKAALKFKEYNTKILVKDEESGVKISNNYKNLCKFINNTVFSQYVYEHIDCKEDSNYYYVNSVGSFIAYNPYDEGIDYPDTMKLILKLPFSLDDSNADSNVNNTYTWEFDKNSSRNKKISFKISKSSIKDAKKLLNKQDEQRKRDNYIKKLKIFGVVLGILVVVGFVVYKYFSKRYKQNKLDY